LSYEIEIKSRAMKDLERVPVSDAKRVLAKVELLRAGLVGDIKRLTNFTPEYRLRVGVYRVLFELESGKVVVYRVLHRKEAYR
jgi:mRNA interferase RelE/StbE